MIEKNKRVFIRFLTVAALLLTALGLRFVPVSNPMGGALLMCTRCAIHVSLLAAWTVSLHRRLTEPRLQRILVATGILMLLWLTAKTVKHEFLIANTHPLGRYIWYGFYIPMLLIPLFGAFVVDCIGKPEDHRPPKWLRWLYLPAFLLIAMVLTNDLHQWVFRFPKGFENYDRDYSYGFPYFILMAWYILFLLYFVLALLKKSRVPGSKKMQKLPLVIALGGVAFWVVYVLKLIRVDLTVIDCIIIASLLESSIFCGMIPSNTDHRKLFRVTTIPIHILDRAYRPCFVSPAATPLEEAQLRQCAQSTVDLGDTLLHSAPITAGRVVWEDDIRRINRLRQLLQDTQEQLSEEIVLRQAEAEVTEKRAEVDERNRLYDRISREVQPQLIRAEELLLRMEKEPEHTKKLLARICVISSCIKRLGNLLLLGEEAPDVPAVELEYCIRESLEYLRLYGAAAALESSCADRLALADTIMVYQFCQAVIERFLDDMTAMLINLSCRDGEIRLTIQVGCSSPISPQALDDLIPSRGCLSREITEDDLVLCLTVSKGGGAQ